MGRQFQPINVNNFVRGLITEVSPLTFPEGASLDEVNFILNKDGTRRRRYGMYEEGTPLDIESAPLEFSSFNQPYVWEAPGGYSGLNFVVLQDKYSVLIFDTSQTGATESLVAKVQPKSYKYGQDFSFTSVDGSLIIASGGSSLTKVDYFGRAGTQVSNYTLKVRDVFGVDDNMYEGMAVTFRPTDYNKLHKYNLRNQSWAVPRYYEDNNIIKDPIDSFRSIQYSMGLSQLKYPSNADTVNQALFANPNNPANRLVESFYPKEVYINPVGTSEAPKGYFIIDALNRGASRREEYDTLVRTYPQILSDGDLGLPDDYTEQGATVVSEFAGRIWYAGFGRTTKGDRRSPNLSSYLLFSQLIVDPTNFGACYQAADPTSPKDFELVDTDGGFIRIDGANEIRKMVNIGRKLIVMADNGIWSVEGGSDYGFTATNYMVKKITDKGVLSKSSVVLVDQNVIFWSDSSINILVSNEIGDLSVENITNTTIQKLYDLIPYQDKIYASGCYDSYDQTVRWVYSGNKELVFDLVLKAFYKHEYNDSRSIRSVFNVPAFRDTRADEVITVGGETVTVEGDPVVISFSQKVGTFKEVKYAVTQGFSKLKLAFASMTDQTFKDWNLYDAEAFLITGQLTAGDFMRKKSVTYLTLHFMRTELGIDFDFEPVNPGSCKVRVCWDWTTSRNSGKWGREFQGYRFRRTYFPPSSDPLSENPGIETVVTKNKIRGSGLALSIHFRTEPGKDCHILGWSMILGVNDNV